MFSGFPGSLVTGMILFHGFRAEAGALFEWLRSHKLSPRLRSVMPLLMCYSEFRFSSLIVSQQLWFLGFFK